MQNSHIEWTTNTYNPIKKKGGGFYCFKVSPACTNCYAETMARRTAAMQGGEFKPYANMKNYPELELRRDMIAGWAQKKKPSLNFVSSMTDIFGEFVDDEWVLEILDGMYAAPLQTFQMLTKRAERAYNLIMFWLRKRGLSQLPANMWIGMSVEDQIRAEERIPWLIKIPAVIRFLSCEPLLGLLDVKYWLKDNLIQWVICGGESGNKKTIRPMISAWARQLYMDCAKYKVPFFFKQFGEWIEFDQMPAEFQLKLKRREAKWPIQNFKWAGYVFTMHRIGKRNTGALLDGLSLKQFPKIAVITP